jgi:predicted dehydrogenase
MTAKIAFAVFGLNQGSKIARDAKNSQDLDLVAVAGFGPQAAEAAAAIDVPLFQDYQALIKNVHLDAAAIALPNQLHKPAVEACLDAGIRNILLEKPIANTAPEGQEIVELCRRAGAVLLIGHHRRSSSKYVFLKEFLASGRLGDLVGVQGSYAIAKPHSYYSVEWHTKLGGGPLLINAIHDVDDLLYTTGMTVDRVYAAARNTIRSNEIEDSVSVVFEFAEGPTATYFISDGTPGPWNYDLAAEENHFFQWCPGENSLRFFGTEGSFGYPNMDFYSYRDGDHGWFKPLVKEHFEVPKNDPMTAELEHFVDLCLGRTSIPRCTGADGIATLKVINAILESAKTKQTVAIT